MTQPFLYDVLVRDSNSWRRTARELVGILDDLAVLFEAKWQRMASVPPEEFESFTTGLFRSTHVYLMLAGYVIENLAKAKIAESLPRANFGAPVGELPRVMHSHNLGVLLKATGFQVTPAEQALLKEVERSTVWEARYPVPAGHLGLSRPYPAELNGPVARALITRLEAFVSPPPSLPKPPSGA